MLKLNSLFWTHTDTNTLSKKFEKLGFDVTPSRRYLENKSLFFGPDSIELVNGQSDEGINKFELLSDDIVNDYKDFKKQKIKLPKPKVATSTDNTPLWYGFDLPQAFVVMDSAETMKKEENEILPLKHPNTVFGYESITYVTQQTQSFADNWGKILNKPVSRLNWNEINKTKGHRVLAGDKFIDAIEDSSSQEHVFMLTFKTVDIELCKKICLEAGAKIQKCSNRDGFIVPGTPHIRFVRAFWKRYLPLTKHHFPYYRREDGFRSLGGAYTSTLKDGFEDNWKY